MQRVDPDRPASASEALVEALHTLDGLEVGQDLLETSRRCAWPFGLSRSTSSCSQADFKPFPMEDS